MPQVKVMVWNIQNFGSAGATYPLYKGTDSAIQAPFIAKVVEQTGVDVLMVMEVFATARASLNNLLTALNANLMDPEWCYDWVKSAVKEPANVTAPANVQSRDDLTWSNSTVSVRAEGYAVFWRDSQHARFTIEPAKRDVSEGTEWDPNYSSQPHPHAIELTLSGRDYITIAPSPGVQSHVGFDPAAPGVGWVWAGYPDVSNYVNSVPRWDRTRRPAVATIQLTSVGGGPAAYTLPILAYHAPSRANLARMGTYLSGLAEELYVMGPPNNPRFYHQKGIAGGDYNVDTRTLDRDHVGDWTVAYKKYFMPFSPGLPALSAWDAGADMDGFNTDAGGHATILKLRHNVNGVPVGAPITNGNLSFYYSRPIDDIFYRNLPGVNAYVGLVPQGVMQGGALAGQPVQNWFDHLVNIAIGAAHIDAHLGPQNPTGVGGALEPIFPSMTDWDEFLAGVQRGYFFGDPNTGVGDARSAAVFVHDFVSDHLPLVVEFNVP